VALFFILSDAAVKTQPFLFTLLGITLFFRGYINTRKILVSNRTSEEVHLMKI